MPKAFKDDDLLYPGEVAQILRVDPKTVTRWALNGKIPAIRTPGGHRRFYYVAVAAVMRGENPWDAVAALHPHTMNPTPTANPTTAAPQNSNPTGFNPTPATRHFLNHPHR